MSRAEMLGRATVLIVSISTAVAGQQSQGQIAVTGGTATDVLGVTSRALTVAPSLSIIADPKLTFSFGGNATRFDNQQWSVAGMAALAARAPLGDHAALTLNGSAAATGTSYNISYYTADALPAAELSAGAFTAFAGAHAATALTSTAAQRLPSQSAGALLGGTSGAGTTASSSVSRSLVGPAFGANVHLTSDIGETLILGYREERGTVDAVPAVDRSAAVAVSSGAMSLGGSVGVRNERGASTTFGSGSLSVAVGPSLSLDMGAGSYLPNRLTGTPGGNVVNAGVSVHFGGHAAAGVELPKPEGIQAPSSGITRLSLQDAQATRVDVAGDFTSWKPIAMQRAANGVWFVDLRIPPGQYRYAFKVDGKEWKAPEGAATVDDDFGGKSAWLTVTAPVRP